MTTYDELGLPIFSTSDKIAATGDGLREDLNLIGSSASNAIRAEGARAESAAKWKRGTIASGTDLYSYEGAGKDGVYASLTAANTATLSNLPPELVTSPRPFTLTVRTLTNTVVLELEILSVYGTVTYKTNSTPSTGTGWTAWERQLNDKDLPALTPEDNGPETVTTPSAFKNVALALTVPANASGTESVPAALLRYPIRYGAPFNRWRFHIQNINDRSGTTYPGAIAFSGAWFGPGSHTTGNGSSAPVRVANAFSTPEDGSEYVSPWISSAPVAAGTNYHLSFGYTAAGGQVNTQSTAAVWRTTTPGDASVASPSGLALSTDSPFSIWIEAEVAAGIPVVGMLGASGPAGVGSTLPVLESPVSIYARNVGALPMHYAHPGSTLAIWKDETHQKWRKWLGYARPDALIVDGASNDVYGSNSLVNIQADTATVLDIAARLATPNLYAMTVHPRDSTTDEAKRRDYNTWLKTLPLSFRDVFDQSAAVSTDDETVLPAYYADGVHTNTAGATAKAGAITRPVITTPAAPTKASLGLDQVTNTSDANKPVSTAQAAAIALKLNISDNRAKSIPEPAFTDAASTYPVGYSIAATALAATGWPVTGGLTVSTFRSGTGRTYQTITAKSPTRTWTRSDIDGTAWTAFVELATTSDIVTAVAAKVGKGELVISVTDAPYLAKGDGTTDDTAAINAADAAAFTSGKRLFVPAGTYRINSTVNFTAAVDATLATFDYYGTGTAIRVGRDAAVTMAESFSPPSVFYKTGAVWATDTVGIEFVNLNTCKVTHSGVVRGFHYAYRFIGKGAGFAYNEIHLGYANQNRVSYHLTQDEGGWCNENNFYSGRIQVVAGMGAVAEDPGAHYLLAEKKSTTISGPNNNRFFGCSFEGSNYGYYRMKFIGSRYNTFYGCRWENYSSTYRIRYEQSSTGNVIQYGYDAWKIVAEADSTSTGNLIFDGVGGTIQARAHSSQVVPTGVETVLNGWATTTTRRSSLDAASGKFTPAEGEWKIDTSVSFNYAAAGLRTAYLAIGEPGGEVTRLSFDERNPGAAGSTVLKMSGRQKFNGTQQVWVVVKQTSGADLTIYGPTGSTTLYADMLMI